MWKRGTEYNMQIWEVTNFGTKEEQGEFLEKTGRRLKDAGISWDLGVLVYKSLKDHVPEQQAI